MMKLKKKSIKKEKKLIKINQVNLSNLQLGSWDPDNPVKRKLKQIMKSNSQSTQYWKIKLKKKLIKKGHKNNQS
jgi:hypothetical protein